MSRLPGEPIAPISPRNILIVRVSAIGDVLMASPVARALREACPSAHIAWLVEPYSAPIVRGNPCVDEVIEFPLPRIDELFRRRAYGAAWRELLGFYRAFRVRRFDLVVDVHGQMKSMLPVWWTRAPRRIGPRNPRNGSALWYTDEVPRPREQTRLADGALAMLRPLGLERAARELILQPPDADVAGARAFLAAQGWADGTPYAACCIASSRPQKDWPLEHWRVLAARLWERRGLRTLLIGGPERRADAARLCAAGMPLASAVGAVSLLESAALVQASAAVIGVDTGLTYAGLPVGLPTVAIYGSTPHRWLADEPRVAVAHHPFPCAPCKKRPTCADYPCMRAVTPEEVLAHLETLAGDDAGRAESACL